MYFDCIFFFIDFTSGNFSHIECQMCFASSLGKYKKQSSPFYMKCYSLIMHDLHRPQTLGNNDEVRQVPRESIRHNVLAN